MSCEPVEWHIKVPNGKYDVKVIIGDATVKTGYSISVNRKTLIDKSVLRKNQFWTPSEVVNVNDGKITLNGDCVRGDCSNVWTRISAIEIYRIDRCLYFTYLFIYIIKYYMFIIIHLKYYMFII